MNRVMEIFQQPLTQRLGWALLSFVWQGAALAVVYALGCSLLRSRASQTRYAAGCLTLLLMAAAPVATFLLAPPEAHTGVASLLGASAVVGSMPGPDAPTSASRASWGDGATGLIEALAERIELLLPWLVGCWLLGVSALSLRMTVGWFQVQRLRQQQTDSFDSEWLGKLNDLKFRLGITRPVRLLKSALVEVPTVIGWLRPVVLFPASLLAGLSPLQLELLLAHELAHVRRHDYWVNLFQLAVETLLFYHPAVWWVSSCIREDREQCCDDLAVTVCGNRLAYARALVTLEELRAAPVALSMAATGGSLPQRIRRLLGLPADASPKNWRRSLGGAFLGLGVLAMLAGFVCLAASTKQYQATTIISVERSGTTAALGTADSPETFDPYFLRTEFEKIRSSSVLSTVAERLGLAAKWQEPNAGDSLSPAEVLARLKRCVAVRYLPDTRMIEIAVVSEDADEAAGIAQAVAEVYQAKRSEQRLANTQRGIDRLKASLAEQEAKVKAVQDEVNHLRDKYQVPDLYPDEPGAITTDAEIIRNIEAKRTAATDEYARWNSYLMRFKGLGNETLLNAIPVNFPDSQLLELTTKRAQAEQEQAAQRKQLAEDHPDVQRLTVLLAKIDEQIEARLSGFMTGLKAKVEASKATVDALREAVEEAKRTNFEKSAQYREYFQAKKDLAAENRVREVLRLKIAQEEVDAQIGPTSPVEVTTWATPQPQAFYPRRKLGLGLLAFGMLSGLVGLAFRVSGRGNAVQPTTA